MIAIPPNILKPAGECSADPDAVVRVRENMGNFLERQIGRAREVWHSADRKK